jgi:hypothetical protein
MWLIPKKSCKKREQFYSNPILSPTKMALHGMHKLQNGMNMPL